MSTQKTTLLVLASTFPRWKNDTEPRFVYDLCLRLKNHFDIIVLAPHSKGSQIHEILDGLNVYRYRYGFECFETLAYEGGITAKLKKNKFNWLMLPFFFIGQWIAIIRLLRQYPVKVIHAHWLIPQASLALLARAFIKNKPAILCTSHGGDLYGLNDFVSKAIKRYVIKNVELLTVVSSAMQLEVKKLVPDADLPTVAPMGTDLINLFIPDDLLKRNPNQLLFVGRLVEKKGLNYLLDALPEIIKKFPSTCLNIAGTGPEKLALELQIKKLSLEGHVNFLGRLSHLDLASQYRLATVAVFPFVQAKDGDIEGLGLVMIEAMGCGCPVIASDIPAVRDVIIDGKTGVLLEPANSKDIATKILTLYTNIQARAKLATQAHKFVVNNFDWNISRNTYSDIIKKLSNNE